MNVEQAHSIDLESFIRQLGHDVVAGKGKAHEAWFKSPFRSEKTPSFKVDRRTNKWKDFAEAYPQGDIIDFVQAYACRQGWGSWDTSQALKELDRLAGGLYIPSFQPYATPPAKQPAAGGDGVPRYVINEVGRIRSGKLVTYLRSRKVYAHVAKTYLQEIHYFDTKLKKSLYGLCWENEGGGYEMRNRFFKTCIGAKAISVVDIQQEATPGIAIFEGMIDFLSYLQLTKHKPLATAVILNSTSMYMAAIEYCQANQVEGPLLGFLQNDRPGLEIAVKLKEVLPQLEVQNHKYSGYGDVNDYLMGKKMDQADREKAEAFLHDHFSISV